MRKPLPIADIVNERPSSPTIYAVRKPKAGGDVLRYKDLDQAGIPCPRPGSIPIPPLTTIKKKRPASAPVTKSKRSTERSSVLSSRYQEIKEIDVIKKLLPFTRPMKRDRKEETGVLE